jgi:hypothetical protein
MAKKSHIPKDVAQARPKGVNKGKPPKATQFEKGNQAAKGHGRPREKDPLKLVQSFFTMGQEDAGDETLIERRIRLLHDIFEEATGRDSITMERKRFKVLTKSGELVEVDKRPNVRLLMYAHQMAFGKIPDEINLNRTDPLANQLRDIADGPDGNKALQSIIDQVAALAMKAQKAGGNG